MHRAMWHACDYALTSMYPGLNLPEKDAIMQREIYTVGQLILERSMPQLIL